MSPQRSDGSTNQTPITAHFKFVAKIVVGLTVASGVLYFGLVIYFPEPSAEVKTAMSVASAGWSTGTGAFFGLLGGKSIQ